MNILLLLFWIFFPDDSKLFMEVNYFPDSSLGSKLFMDSIICYLQEPVVSAGSDSAVAASGAVSAVLPENDDVVVEAEVVVNFPGLEWFPAGLPWPEVANSPVSQENL